MHSFGEGGASDTRLGLPAYLPACLPACILSLPGQYPGRKFGYLFDENRVPPRPPPTQVLELSTRKNLKGFRQEPWDRRFLATLSFSSRASPLVHLPSTSGGRCGRGRGLRLDVVGLVVRLPSPTLRRIVGIDTVNIGSRIPGRARGDTRRHKSAADSILPSPTYSSSPAGHVAIDDGAPIAHLAGTRAAAAAAPRHTAFGFDSRHISCCLPAVSTRVLSIVHRNASDQNRGGRGA